MSNNMLVNESPKKKKSKLKIVLIVIVVILALFILLPVIFGGPSVNNGSSYSKDNLLSSKETDDMFNDTEKYVGKSVNLYGQIFDEVDADGDNVTMFQMHCDPQSGEKAVMVYAKDGYKADYGDIVLVKGVVTDLYTGSSLAGTELKRPLISANTVENTSYIDAFAPAQKTIEPDTHLDIDKVRITVDKVEFAENETRISVTLENNSNEPADISTNYSAIVQNGHQYTHKSYDEFKNFENNTEDYYNLFPDDVKAGATDSGLLVFPSIKQSDFNLLLSVSVNGKGYTDKKISIAVK